MQFHYNELDNGIRLMKLSGMLDLTGVGIAEKGIVEHSTDENVRMLLDLSEITFLASIGIRLIVTTAKSLGSRGGRLVILNPPRSVEEILEVTGIAEIIPICANLDDAKLALAS